MKTQKRDQTARAYHLGYKAGIRGKSVELCPYTVAARRGHWMGGWREGRSDMLAGVAE